MKRLLCGAPKAGNVDRHGDELSLAAAIAEARETRGDQRGAFYREIGPLEGPAGAWNDEMGVVL